MSESIEVAKVNDLMTKKLEMVAKVREIQAEIWKLNQQLHAAGADVQKVACW